MSGTPDPALSHVDLILFSRAPVAGQTKTRLTPPLTPEQARDFHVACLNDLLEAGRRWRDGAAVTGLTVRLHLYITPPASQPVFRSAGVHWPNDYALHNQRGEDLGQRMENAIHHVRNRRSSGAEDAAVILTGTDLPLLGALQWQAAVRALALADVVFGPTPDGGYYLIGVRRDPAGLFTVDRWGSASVLEASLAAAQAGGFSTALIDMLPDADTADDLRESSRHPAAAHFEERASLQAIRALLNAGVI